MWSQRWTEEDLQRHRERQAKHMERMADAETARGRAKYAEQPIASPAPSPKARTQKYGNRKVSTDDGDFDSTKEFRRFQALQLRERAGDIQSLRRQVPFALVVDGVLIGRYIADFVYFEGARQVVEDVKSEPTRKLQLYQWKKRLMLACHKIEIVEV